MRLNPVAIRRFAALFTAATGAMNVVSALYPAIPARMELLRDLLPLHVIRASQTLTVLAGFLLIILADGLWKRRRRALHITVGLLLVVAFLNLTKGLDYEEAIVGLLLALGLISGHTAFDLSSRPAAPGRVLRKVGTFLLLYYGYVLSGFFILRGVVWPAPTLLDASLEPVRLFAANPLYSYLTPQAQWFERSMVLVGAVGVLYSLVQLLRPLLPAVESTPDEREQVREILQRHGSDALSYFALQDGRSYFFDPTGEAVVSYRLYGTVALVGGDPLGPAYRIPALLTSFLDFTEANGIDVCLLGASPRFLPLFAALGLKTLKIGEEAVIDLPSFEASTLKRKVRRAARHVSECGISVATYPAHLVPPDLRRQMEEINRTWIEDKGGAYRGFSMTLGRLPGPEDADCEVVVAWEGGRLWGYLCLVPIFGTGGWSLDAMRRRADAPNGLTEFLVINAAELYRARGCSALSLNFATLCNTGDDIDSRMVERTRRFLYEHLSSFYQLKSLYQFNSKFNPRWNSRYMAYRDVLKFPKLAVAIVQSEDPVRLPSVPGLRR